MIQAELEKTIAFAQSLEDSRHAAEELYRFLLKAFGLKAPPDVPRKKRGKLITFDGHSGAGKDTQMRILTEHLARDVRYSGFHVADLVQKTNDPFRQAAKHFWANRELFPERDCSFLLLTAGRRYFVETVVAPRLEASECIVVQNRSYLSHVAYHGLSVEELPALLDLCDFDPQPDASLVLACDVETACERIRRRAPQKGGTIYPNEKSGYIARVKSNFEELATLVKGLIFIDTSGDVSGASREIERHVATCLGRDI